MQSFVRHIVQGRHLTRSESREAFEKIMSGQSSEVEIAALLVAMACRGQDVEELVGAAEVMRQKVVAVRCEAPDAIDTCGTGGDGISTFNVSTASAIVAAAAGATVAKHGNRTNTRASGSAEVIEALGVNVSADVPTIERCLREARIGFLFATQLHPAMKYAAPVRRMLGIPTIFNLLGPLTNPAGVQRQVMGVSRSDQTEKIARVLAELGIRHAMVVHGSDGLCDLTLTGPSRITEVRAEGIRTYTVKPEEVGLPRVPLDALRVDSPSASAAAIREVLAGKTGPRRDMVLLNASAALVVSGRAKDLVEGVSQAAKAIDAGAAAATLQRWADVSQGA